MRPRRNREINIFSMSALDLFASGLGAFLILMVILFPFYKKETDTLSKLAEAQQSFASCRQSTASTQQALSQCREKLKSTMLLVTLSWQAEGGARSSDDVDMHITDPAGHYFYYSKANNPPGTHYPVQARISKDITETPGYEIFEDPVARTGTYNIAVELYNKPNRGQQPLKAELKIYTSAGVTEMPVITLNPSHDAGRRIKMANVVVGTDGDVSVNAAR